MRNFNVTQIKYFTYCFTFGGFFVHHMRVNRCNSTKQQSMTMHKIEAQQKYKTNSNQEILMFLHISKTKKSNCDCSSYQSTDETLLVTKICGFFSVSFLWCLSCLIKRTARVSLGGWITFSASCLLITFWSGDMGGAIIDSPW